VKRQVRDLRVRKKCVIKSFKVCLKPRLASRIAAPRGLAKKKQCREKTQTGLLRLNEGTRPVLLRLKKIQKLPYAGSDIGPPVR